MYIGLPVCLEPQNKNDNPVTFFDVSGSQEMEYNSLLLVYLNSKQYVWTFE